MKRALPSLAFALAVSATCLSAQAPPRPVSASGGTSEASLEAVRAAAEKFKDVNVALAEGYIPDPMNICDTAELMGKPADLGVMGIHYFRPDLLGITGPPNPRVDGAGTHTDFLNPAILIYEPQADGSLQLMAVENLVFIKAWEAAGNKTPPSFQGVPYDRMADDLATARDEAHYDRHELVALRGAILCRGVLKSCGVSGTRRAQPATDAATSRQVAKRSCKVRRYSEAGRR